MAHIRKGGRQFLWAMPPGDRVPAAIAVAGFTAHAPEPHLADMAHALGRPIVFRSEHRRLPDGQVLHVLHGAELIVLQSRRFTTSRDWPVTLADLVWLHPPEAYPMVTHEVLGPGGDYFDDQHDVLCSWIFGTVGGTP